MIKYAMKMKGIGKMNHIFYQTKTKFTNTGDALINSALINSLREYGKIYANCSADIPEDFINALGIRSNEKIISNSEITFVKNVLATVRKSGKNDKVYVFSGPGDMYGNGFRLIVRNFLSVFIFALFRLNGVIIVRIGRSVGPISKLLAISEVARCKLLSYYYVRDSKSLERCKKIGISKTKQCPDMSWLYLNDTERKINVSNIVMVNLRNSIFDDVHQEFIDKTIQTCQLVLEELEKKLLGKMKVRIAYQIDEDKEFSRYVYDSLKGKFDCEYIDSQIKLNEMSDVYGDCIFHISNRMHSLLAGYKFGSLPLAVIDEKVHTKISATLYDCELEKIIFDINSKENNTREHTQNIFDERTEILNHIFLCEQNCQKEILDTLDCIFDAK